MDNYNAYVMHPMNVAMLEVMAAKHRASKQELEQAIKRMVRHSEFCERLICPDGTYPAYGRSVTYRTAAFQSLADVALRHLPPQSTAIIFTSDHGGRGKGHGGKSMEEMNVLFALKGRGIPAGEQMGIPMMKYDVAPTILQLLRLKAPDAWRGKSILR